MATPQTDKCLTFCLPDKTQPGVYVIQWQFPRFTVTCKSPDLLFAGEIQKFVAETRANPAYRDTPLGNGVYRPMDEKCVDLSRYFQGVRIKLHKSGEYDDAYSLEFERPDCFSFVAEMHADLLDSFLRGIAEDIYEVEVANEIQPDGEGGKGKESNWIGNR